MFTRDDIEKALDYMDQAHLIRLARSSSNSRWRQLYCPFHNNGQEQKPSCGCALEEGVRNGQVYPAGFFHCFSCGAKYPLANGIKEILTLKGISIEAHPFLKPYLEGQVQTDLNSLIPRDMMSGLLNKYAAESLKMRVKGMQKFVSEEELKTYRFTVPYMYQRKLTDAVIEKYDVGFDGKFIPEGRKKPLPCVTFPVKDIQGRTLFIARRSIEGKFFNLPSNIEKPVYGMYELPPQTKEVIICESIFNTLTSVVYGRPSEALFGTGTPYQYNQLRKQGVTSYVLWLDNDEAGRRGVARFKKALWGAAMIWTVTGPADGRDVNDLERDEFEYYYSMRE